MEDEASSSELTAPALHQQYIIFCKLGAMLHVALVKKSYDCCTLPCKLARLLHTELVKSLKDCCRLQDTSIQDEALSVELTHLPSISSAPILHQDVPSANTAPHNTAYC